jgi:hypothetical protein
MKDDLDSLLEQIKLLEKRILQSLQNKEAAFFYKVREGKVRFTAEARTRHQQWVKNFARYIRDSQFLIVLTTPLIWACLIPIAMLDLAMRIYQGVCFPIYGIPKVQRRDYILLDRRHLAYLNWVEKLNCEYCGYANGVLAWSGEIGARTEQYWCPIKHALRTKSMHSRYRMFFDYGDAEHYRQQLETLRRSFEDIAADSQNEQTKSGKKE